MINCSELPAGSIMWLVAAGLATRVVSCIIYNLFWHPLASFPGPFVAAVTPLYKAYIDLVAKSSLVHTLEKLHSQYGDIVRISPNETSFGLLGNLQCIQ